LTELEKRLLATVCAEGQAEARLCIRSRLRIDAGRWWWRTPLWVCVTDAAIVLLAVARRHYVEQVPLANCRESRYCHESGELLLAPVETLLFNRIRMSPRDALAVLRLIGG
jgi:hypothetical protein